MKEIHFKPSVLFKISFLLQFFQEESIRHQLTVCHLLLLRQPSGFSSNQEKNLSNKSVYSDSFSLFSQLKRIYLGC